MVCEEIKYRIIQLFGFPPTVEQQHAIDVLSRFMTDRDEQAVMVLRGSAGTGKTTLAAAVVRALTALGQKLVLLAPTGRAAKVLSLYASHPASTIHRRIYRKKTFESTGPGAFSLNYNNMQDTLFIVDEASMVSNQTAGDLFSGQASLLDDLIRFVYNQRNCRLMIIGDPAQLPPVGETRSPALQPRVLGSYGLRVYEATLNEVLRQSLDSGILLNATHIRNIVPPENGGQVVLPQICFNGFPDIRRVPGDELIETLAGSYSHAGVDDTIVITRSNKRANIYNQGIRNTVLGREEELCRGDLLMIVKNNYSIPLPHSSEEEGLTFLANGDRAVVQRVRHIHELYGFRFADVTMTLPDYGDYELTATVLLDTLTSEAPALTRQQQEQLFLGVMADYSDIPRKADRLKKVKEDPHYNALQVKFAYAVTCHKAQGGQWAHVYVDQGYMTDDMLTTDYLHWLYTALTRATERLFLVNWPKELTEK